MMMIVMIITMMIEQAEQKGECPLSITICANTISTIIIAIVIIIVVILSSIICAITVIIKGVVTLEEPKKTSQQSMLCLYWLISSAQAYSVEHMVGMS